MSVVLAISILTLNLRISSANDGEYSWQSRQEAVVAAISDLQPDVFSVQEASLEQDSFLVARLTDYTRVPLVDTIHHSTQIVNGVFYRRDRFELLSANLFWLSSTPNTPSTGWQAAYPRVANYALLQETKTEKSFLIVNTHLDHVSAEARTEGLRLIADSIVAITHDTVPVFLTGDFNVPPTDSVLLVLHPLMRSAAEVLRDSTPTFHDFGRHTKGGEQIDYIFFRHATPTSYRVIRHGYGIPFLSDHYPVVATF